MWHTSSIWYFDSKKPDFHTSTDIIDLISRVLMLTLLFKNDVTFVK